MLRRESPHDDRHIERYVLGLLPEDAAERLDEAGIVDDEFAVRLRGVENDLVDGYLRGTLAPETLARFESNYLSSPRRRENVRFARSFVRAVDRLAAEERTLASSDPRPHGWRRTILRWPALSTLAAAAALLLVVGGTLRFIGGRPRSGSRAAQAPATTAGRGPREPNERVAERGAPGAPAAAPPSSGPAKPPARAAVSLILLPQTRSIGAVPTLAIPPDAERALFELELEANEFPRYQVGLRDPATNRVVWRSVWIAAKSQGDRASVSVAVPASVLGSQHYSLDLSARTETGATEVVGSYAVRIVTR